MTEEGYLPLFSVINVVLARKCLYCLFQIKTSTYIAPNFSAKILTYVSVKKVGNIKLKKNCPTITILIVDF